MGELLVVRLKSDKLEMFENWKKELRIKGEKIKQRLTDLIEKDLKTMNEVNNNG